MIKRWLRLEGCIVHASSWSRLVARSARGRPNQVVANKGAEEDHLMPSKCPCEVTILFPYDTGATADGVGVSVRQSTKAVCLLKIAATQIDGCPFRRDARAASMGGKCPCEAC